MLLPEPPKVRNENTPLSGKATPADAKRKSWTGFQKVECVTLALPGLVLLPGLMHRSSEHSCVYTLHRESAMAY